MPPGVRRRAWIGPPVRERKTVHATTALPEPSETIAGCVVRTPSGVICRRGPTAVPSAPRRWTRRTPGPPPKPVGTFELTQARRTSPALVAASRGAKARWSGSATCTGAPKPPPRGRIATWTALPEPLLSSHAATAVPVVLIATCGARTRPEADSTCGGPNSRPAGAWAAIARPEAESTQTTTVVPSASIATCGSAPTPGAGSANGAPRAVPVNCAPASDVRRDQTSSRVPPGPATNDGEYADSVPSVVSACVRIVRPPAIVAARRRSARFSTRRQAVTRSAPLAGSPTARLSTKRDERSRTIEGPRSPLRVVPWRTSARLSPRIWRTKPIARRPRTSAATAGCDMRPVLPTACGVLHDAAVAEAGWAAAANAAAARGRGSERLIAPGNRTGHEEVTGALLQSFESMTRRPVDAHQSFPDLEQQVLERWRERDVFRESIRRREGAQPWVFYEGPPTANGRPGSHHVLSRVFKDIYPRFKTMRGFYVERKGGWDCHGL